MELTGPNFVISETNYSYTCSAYGGPENVFIWMINGTVIEDDDQYDINREMTNLTSSSSELKILSVDAATNKGNYSCNVSNIGGFGEDSILVTGNKIIACFH